jgi:hypothetical protein
MEEPEMYWLAESVGCEDPYRSQVAAFISPVGEAGQEGMSTSGMEGYAGLVLWGSRWKRHT